MQQTTDTPDTPTTAGQGARRRRWLWPALLVGAVVVAVGLWLTQPWLLLVDTVADEQLPVSIADAATDVVDEDAAAAAEPAAGTTSDQPDAAADPATGTTDDGAALGANDDDVARDDGAGADEVAAPQAGPVVLLRGSFVSRDHGTSGAVAVVELADGSRVLTIEDLDTDNGPDLFVYLDDDAADAPEGDFDDGLSLGRLRANQGDLVYEIPDDVDLATIASVGIWCDRFSSLFGAADLALPA